MTDNELKIAALKVLDIIPDIVYPENSIKHHRICDCSPCRALNNAEHQYPISSTEGRDIIARLEEKLLVTDEEWEQYLWNSADRDANPFDIPFPVLNYSTDFVEYRWIKGLRKVRQASPLACLRAMAWKLVKP